MSEKIFYENWIADNFKGLSSSTLAEFIHMNISGYKQIASNVVYCTLYNYATKKDMSDKTFNTFMHIKNDVENCTWL